VRTFSCTIVALAAFAANSILCRLALRTGSIDPASFLTVRIAAGAAMLLLVTASAREQAAVRSGSWGGAALLILYGVPFSFAYLQLSAGTGALILFGAVQLTMMGSALTSGERPAPTQCLGVALAAAGLVYLVLPGLAAPPLTGALLMAVAGVAWGLYSLQGRGAGNPLAQNTSNFVRALPLVIAANLIALQQAHVTGAGLLLAVASGALASGLGYVVWYIALRGLTAARAAVVQLAVPVIAAAGGVLFLSEALSRRLIVAAVMILGGIALALRRLSEKASGAARSTNAVHHA
jgi:drug/metabolite transporter (DMT)-like permease